MYANGVLCCLLRHWRTDTIQAVPIDPDSQGVLFVETPTFTRQLQALYAKRALSSDGYRELQNALYEETTRIDSIPGVADVYKARWGASGRGKRGGLRILFFNCARRGTVYLLVIYEKADREDLTPDQRKRLARLVDDELRPSCT